MARNTVNLDNLDIWPLSVENEALLKRKFHLIVVSIFLKTRVKVHGAGDSFSRLQERRICLICFEALL